MSLTIDVSGLVATSKKLAELRSTGADAIMRTVAVSMGGEIRDRIHGEGLKADGTKIGKYSKEYMKVRQRKENRTGSDVILSFTRQMENDFVAVAENPLRVDGGYGIGFNNPINALKADVLQFGRVAGVVKQHTRKTKFGNVEVTSHYRKGTRGYGEIYKLTPDEKKQVKEIVEYETNQFLNQ